MTAVLLVEGLHKSFGGVQAVAARYPNIITEVLGKSLMIGLKCEIPNGDVVARLMAHGLLTVGAGDNVVRLVPPLTIGDSDIDAAVSIIEKSAAELAAA